MNYNKGFGYHNVEKSLIFLAIFLAPAGYQTSVTCKHLQNATSDWPHTFCTQDVFHFAIQTL